MSNSGAAKRRARARRAAGERAMVSIGVSPSGARQAALVVSDAANTINRVVRRRRKRNNGRSKKGLRAADAQPSDLIRSTYDVIQQTIGHKLSSAAAALFQILCDPFSATATRGIAGLGASDTFDSYKLRGWRSGSFTLNAAGDGFIAGSPALYSNNPQLWVTMSTYTASPCQILTSDSNSLNGVLPLNLTQLFSSTNLNADDTNAVSGRIIFAYLEAVDLTSNYSITGERVSLVARGNNPLCKSNTAGAGNGFTFTEMQTQMNAISQMERDPQAAQLLWWPQGNSARNYYHNAGAVNVYPLSVGATYTSYASASGSGQGTTAYTICAPSGAIMFNGYASGKIGYRYVVFTEYTGPGINPSLLTPSPRDEIGNQVIARAIEIAMEAEASVAESHFHEPLNVKLVKAMRLMGYSVPRSCYDAISLAANDSLVRNHRMTNFS